MKKWISMPSAAAPPTGASHISLACEEKVVSAGSKATVHTAAKPTAPSPALTPQRGLVLTSMGQATANRATSTEMTSGPVSLGRLGINTVTTAKTAAAATVVKAEIVVRTLPSCHGKVFIPPWKTTVPENLRYPFMCWHDTFPRDRCFRHPPIT